MSSGSRVAAEKSCFAQISQALVDTFVTAIEREDIEALAGALYKIPKTVEKFAERYILFSDRLRRCRLRVARDDARKRPLMSSCR